MIFVRKRKGQAITSITNESLLVNNNEAKNYHESPSNNGSVANEAKYNRRTFIMMKRISYPQKAAIALVTSLWLILLSTNIYDEMGQEQEDIMTKVTSFIALESEESGGDSYEEKAPHDVQIFKWACWDKCSCLPPVMQNENDENFKPYENSTNRSTDSSPTIIMHQSYKTSDPQTWHWGWKSQRRTWMDLHPHWYFIFWNDEQNELLAHCTGFGDVLEGRSGIQKADLSRLLYMHRYGGFYSDMDYIALQNHHTLLESEQNQIKHQQILLQGREEQVVGFEWGYARRPGHPLWDFCLGIARGQQDWKKLRCPISYTGPLFLKRCLKKYFKLRTNETNIELEHMISYGDQNDLMILEPNLISPLRGDDFTSECGKWRNLTEEEKRNDRNEIAWTKVWPKSPCKEKLIGNGTYAVTLYSHSWGVGLKCDT